MRQGRPEDCWPWRTGKRAVFWWRDQDGDRRYALASRVAFALSYGPIPRGLVVAHSCDNPPCCNPRHISAKTQRENVLEAIERGLRTYDTPRYLETRNGWWRHGANGPGEENGNVKLTNSDVASIRAALKTGERQVDIATRFKISQSTVSRIARHETRPMID